MRNLNKSTTCIGACLHQAASGKHGVFYCLDIDWGVRKLKDVAAITSFVCVEIDSRHRPDLTRVFRINGAGTVTVAHHA